MNTTSLTKLHHEMVALRGRAEKAEAELQKLREQKPVAWVDYIEHGDGSVTHNYAKEPGATYARPLYADPVAAPAAHAVHSHPDDAAVDRFAAAMKAKMAASRAKGRGGWEDKDYCKNESLQQMLIGHLSKGDPVDVGNFCMMLWNRGEPVAAPAVPAPSVPEEWREIMAGLVAIAEKKGKKHGSPNHCHQRPGVWDDDNGPALSGKPCAECAMYDRARALLQSAPQAPVDKRCEYCDGTGDVHSPDGEWRGVCCCVAGEPFRTIAKDSGV